MMTGKGRCQRGARVGGIFCCFKSLRTFFGQLFVTVFYAVLILNTRGSAENALRRVTQMRGEHFEIRDLARGLQDTFLAAYHERGSAPFPFGSISDGAQWRSLETSFKPVNDNIGVQRWKALRAGETSSQRKREFPMPGLPGVVLLMALEKLLEEDLELASPKSEKAFKSLIDSKVVVEDYMTVDAFYRHQRKTTQQKTKLEKAENRYHLLVTYPSVCINKQLYLLDRTSGERLFRALQKAPEKERLKYLVTDCFPSISGALQMWVPRIFNSVASYSTRGLRKYPVDWDSVVEALKNPEKMRNLLESSTYINHFLYCKLHLEWEMVMKVLKKEEKDHELSICLSYLGIEGRKQSLRGTVPLENAFLLPVLKPLEADRKGTGLESPAKPGTSRVSRITAMLSRIGKVGKRKNIPVEYGTSYKNRIKALMPRIEKMPTKKGVVENGNAYKVLMKAVEPTSEQTTGAEHTLKKTAVVGAKISEEVIYGIPSKMTPVNSKVPEETTRGIPGKIVPVNTAEEQTHEPTKVSLGKSALPQEVAHALLPLMTPVGGKGEEQNVHTAPTSEPVKAKVPEETTLAMFWLMAPVEWKVPSRESTGGSATSKKEKQKSGTARESPFDERERSGGVTAAPGTTTVRTRSPGSKKPNLSKAGVLDIETTNPASTDASAKELSALRWNGLKLASTKPAVLERTFLEVKEFSVNTGPSNEAEVFQPTAAPVTESASQQKNVTGFAGFPIGFGGFPKSLSSLLNWRQSVPNWAQGYIEKKK